MKMNVKENKYNGLCCSCGICSAVCNRDAINYERIKGMYVPVIDENKCINCGICAEICPGFNQIYSSIDNAVFPDQIASRNVIKSYNAWSKDKNIRHISASGGVTTTIIEELLAQSEYECVFCVDNYSYDKQLNTERLTYQNFIEQRDNNWVTPKSRYLPVSHENTVRYMINNKESKLIIVAVPCVLNSLCRVIQKYKLKRDNYLLIGLFCERNFQYNIYDYFSSLEKKKQLISLNFKNKDSGGWPGNLKLFYSDNTYSYKDMSFRTTAKPFFQPERCLYCIDKLAECADIALGDNYTGVNSSKLGSNSVIIRTNVGLDAWHKVENKLEIRDISFCDIEKAEVMDERLNNVYYSEIKKKELKFKKCYIPEINKGVAVDDIPKEYEKKYKIMLDKISIGERYREEPKLYKREFKKIFWTKKKNNIAYKTKLIFIKMRNIILRKNDCM